MVGKQEISAPPPITCDDIGPILRNPPCDQHPSPNSKNPGEGQRGLLPFVDADGWVSMAGGVGGYAGMIVCVCGKNRVAARSP